MGVKTRTMRAGMLYGPCGCSVCESSHDTRIGIDVHSAHWTLFEQANFYGSCTFLNIYCTAVTQTNISHTNKMDGNEITEIKVERFETLDEDLQSC